MILTEDDLPIYAPGVSLVDDEFRGAIRRLESIIESDIGAGRPLEIQERVEQGTVLKNTQYFLLRQYPIDLTVTPIIKVRAGGSVSDGWRRGVTPGEWLTLTSEQYQLDSDGSVFLNPEVIGLYLDNGWDRNNWGKGRYIQESDRGGILTAYHATYTAGYVFETNTPTAEVEKIKAAAGAILGYVQQSSVFAGISEVQVPFDEFRIKYAIGSTASDVIGKIPEEMLRPFRDLRARSEFV